MHTILHCTRLHVRISQKSSICFVAKTGCCVQLIQTGCTNLQKLAVSVLDAGGDQKQIEHACWKSLCWDRFSRKTWKYMHHRRHYCGCTKKVPQACTPPTTENVKLFNSLGRNKTSNAGYCALCIFRSLHPFSGSLPPPPHKSLGTRLPYAILYLY